MTAVTEDAGGEVENIDMASQIRNSRDKSGRDSNRGDSGERNDNVKDDNKIDQNQDERDVSECWSREIAVSTTW